MIKSECFTKEWITGFRGKRKNCLIDPGILEKTIRALSLLQHLCKSNIDFIFKGGTSLILLLKQPQRFSIDLDIITENELSEFEKALDQIVEKSKFLSCEFQEHRSFTKDLPKAHFKLQFISALSNRPNTILLDLLFQKNP